MLTPLILIGFITLFIIPPVYAQNTTTKIDTPAQVQQTTLPVDATTFGAIGATALGLYANDRKDKKDTKEQLAVKDAEIARLNKEKQESEEIQDAIQVAMYKIFTAASLYPTKSLKQILDLKATNNPLEKNTLGEDLATQVNRKVRLSTQIYNIPMPNMSVPSEQVVNATTVVPINKVETKPPQAAQQTK